VRRSGRRAVGLPLLAAAGLILAPGCTPPSVRIVSPRDGALVDDAAVAASITIPQPGFDLLSGTVRIDGVDLVDALGLTAPFSGEGGVVVIGGQPVAIADFSYAVPATGPAAISFTATGLGLGAHVLEAQASRSGGAIAVRVSDFERVEPFGLAAEVIAAAGQPMGLASSPLGARLGNATLGEAAAGPPSPMAGGGTLREGFVPVARALAAGAP
jgi:hypothetical protein